MLPRVFEIDEIFRLIASRVVDFDGSSAIALACCCKALQDPVLRLCWEGKSLDNLAAVLPAGVLARSGHSTLPYYTTIRSPTQQERHRLLRYASWIKRIEGLFTRRFEAFFDILHSSSPTETPFPNLRTLSWCIYPSFLRFLPLFVSPLITTFSVTVHKDKTFDPKTMERDYLSAAIAALPTSLREFTLRINPAGLGNDELKEEVLRAVHRCGPILTHLEIDVELPAVMIQHVMELPKLRTWKVHGNLPPATLTPSSEVASYLPALSSLTLAATNARDWVTFLSIPHPKLTAIRSTLTELNLSDHQDVDPTLISQLCVFQNLTHLHVGASCPDDRCAFSLTDDDVSDLSWALPRLESLMLGHQCDRNTCRTTVRSLLFLSARCPGLVFLSIHFNTAQIAQDIQSLFETWDSSVRNLRESSARCLVTTLSVSQTPLPLAGTDELEVVKRGFLNVFPQLKAISRKYAKTWRCLTEALGK
ncbi:hypothetical protein BJ322DRAFT_1112762 [Thelephora terrestris]|uniref:F-box domain-containing protein n=1 Tax=Thelephora terrestris TaxID=56493 RepID=A0A9P6H5U4_9AGAM|nr:hypothetical protein BJ322DRAFT_1112762 [Thelephora terrestris]